MVNKDLREIIADCNDEAILFDNPSFDNSIIGVSTDGNVIYSLELMIEELMNDDNISYEEALEFIDYNTIRVLPYAGEYAPIIMDMNIVSEECKNRLVGESYGN